jgi:hypothetical protein
MKKYLIVLLVLIACNLMSEDVRIIWNDNPSADSVLTYTVYVAQGSDSTLLTLVPVATVNDVWDGGECEYIVSFDSSYIQAAISATNRHGTGERSDPTKIYSRGELLVPGKALMAAPAIRGN